MPTSSTCEFCGKKREPLFCSIMGQDILVGWKNCNCQDALEAMRIENERKEAEEMRRIELEIERRLLSAGIPKRYWRATTDRSDLIEKAKETGLYIQGKVGVGKTYLACAIGVQLVKERHSVLFAKASDLVDMLSMFQDNFDSINKLRAPDVLIIDDLGMEEARDWTDRRIRRAIDARWDSDKPVIVTSNFSKQQLYEQLAKNDETNAAAVVSRLFGMTDKVEITGEDRRMTQ